MAIMALLGGILEAPVAVVDCDADVAVWEESVEEAAMEAAVQAAEEEAAEAAAVAEADMIEEEDYDGGDFEAAEDAERAMEQQLSGSKRPRE